MSFGQNCVLGYWPSSLFTYLADSATMVEWGGEVVNSSPDGHHTGTQMGSGRFANDGFGYAGFFHSLQVHAHISIINIYSPNTYFTYTFVCIQISIYVHTLWDLIIQ